MRKKIDVVETSQELGDVVTKEAESYQKVVPMPQLPPQFPKRLVKKMENGKYRCFFSMLKQLSINVLFIETLKQIARYAMLMKDMVTQKRSLSF